MGDKIKIVVDWESEQKKIEEEYKRKLAELRKMKQDNEMVDKILTRGILPVLILSVISNQPSNGNELSNRIADITDGAWQPSTGGIYPILKRFEKEGLITGKWDDPDKRIKKIYTITEDGIDELKIQKNGLIRNLNKTVEIFNSIIETIK